MFYLGKDFSSSHNVVFRNTGRVRNAKFEIKANPFVPILIQSVLFLIRTDRSQSQSVSLFSMRTVRFQSQRVPFKPFNICFRIKIVHLAFLHRSTGVVVRFRICSECSFIKHLAFESENQGYFRYYFKHEGPLS